jgi:Fels-1 Prophage Protein-like
MLSVVAVAVSVCVAQPTLPAGLESPENGVICNRSRSICYDRSGTSIGLTEEFLGHAAAERLTANLRRSGSDNRPRQTSRPPMESSAYVKPGPVASSAGQTQRLQRFCMDQRHAKPVRTMSCTRSFMGSGTGLSLGTAMIQKFDLANRNIMFCAFGQTGSSKPGLNATRLAESTELRIMESHSKLLTPL